MKTIAIIDDDVYIGNLVEEILKKEGFQVLRAYSGTEALYLLSCQKPDLILLDLMLPGLSGEEILPKISGIPVIVISAKAGIDDKVNLLLGGASDYITKPFSTKELLARITVQLRKKEESKMDSLLVSGDLKLNPFSHEVKAGKTSVSLTKTEYAILKLLMKNSGQVISKSVILDRISEDTPDCTDSSLKQHISNLRRKLRDAGGKNYIEAVWGIGFKLV
nr:response regulator transcription factor [uncultured Sellimonas sp.]